MQKLNKVNAEEKVILNIKTSSDPCNVCAVPGNSTSGQYASVKALG